ncbi:MAG: HPr(Ser) kinase/phosphatase [Clostridia bacterium]|nr:HPr(Ser) kinase/phosphatase [Clostridia bacterium]
MISPERFARELGLKTIVSAPKRGMHINVADLCRPGLQFAGYFDVFASERPQLIGWTEMQYLSSLPISVLTDRLKKYFSYKMPCIIIARGMPCLPALAEEAKAHGVAIYGTEDETSAFTGRAIAFLSEQLAPRETCHGVLVDIYGVGVLITGESGVGKSECALELIKRGHLLVADDVVDIARVGHRLRGEAPEIVRELMELRGVGLVNIKSIFGSGAVMRRKTIDMIIRLENWSLDKDYERLGNKDEKQNILGIELPLTVMPVRSGRNLAIIVEIAARNWRLKAEGNDAVSELERRMMERYSRSRDEDEEEA